jgi:CheY-like chemotaxis protein
VVRVSDNGQGIASEFLPHVFSIFRQEDASKSRHHGGYGPGRGAVFTVALPVSERGDIALAQGDLGRPDLAGTRILVVDDDEATRDLLSRALGEMGATVVSAASATEARAEITRQRPDAIVSDVGMPDEDGLAFMRSLRETARASRYSRYRPHGLRFEQGSRGGARGRLPRTRHQAGPALPAWSSDRGCRSAAELRNFRFAEENPNGLAWPTRRSGAGAGRRHAHRGASHTVLVNHHFGLRLRHRTPQRGQRLTSPPLGWLSDGSSRRCPACPKCGECYERASGMSHNGVVYFHADGPSAGSDRAVGTCATSRPRCTIYERGLHRIRDSSHIGLLSWVNGMTQQRAGT